MLTRLRRKFIALIMASVAGVLVVSFVTICVMDWRQSVNQVYTALNESIDQAVMFNEGMQDGRGLFGGPGGMGPAGGPEREGDGLADGRTGFDALDEFDNLDDTDDLGELNDSANGLAGYMRPQIGGNKGGSLIPVAVYTMSEGQLSCVTAATTAQIADDTLQSAQTLLANAPEGTGHSAELGLFYARRTSDGVAYYAFADSSSASGWQRLALTLTGVGLAALAAFFVIAWFFSRWALRPVEESWESQRQFVADASHELKTPLTVILANTSILLEHPERSIASESQWVESTQTEAVRMQELVNDMLALARLDAAADAPLAQSRDERLDLSELVEGSLLTFESVAYERGVMVDSAVQERVHVLGNAAELGRLVGTLLDNACKYAGMGGSVDARLSSAEGSAVLAVHNTGIAIPADELPHVFDRFWRADKARTQDGSGYGLGLAIAKEIAQAHKGSIAVESSDASGTTFTVRLPLA